MSESVVISRVFSPSSSSVCSRYAYSSQAGKMSSLHLPKSESTATPPPFRTYGAESPSSLLACTYQQSGALARLHHLLIDVESRTRGHRQHNKLIAIKSPPPPVLWPLAPPSQVNLHLSSLWITLERPSAHRCTPDKPDGRATPARA